MLKKAISIMIFLILITICTFGCENNESPKPNAKGDLYLRYHDSSDELHLEKVTDASSYEIYLPAEIEGHEFMAWYLDEELTIPLKIADLPIATSEDIYVDVYPEWYIINYKVEFYSDHKLLKTESVPYLASAKAPSAKVIPGYKFVDWDQDFSEVKENLKVNALYEENNESDVILVVLGNYLNDDGTISATLKKRLQLALEANEIYKPSYIVLSGGVANGKAGISEAQAMYNYLLNNQMEVGLLIKEERSLSTYQNAIYSIKILEDFSFTKLVIVSTIEHFTYYDTVKYFEDAIANNNILKNKNIEVLTYTNNE